jgi:hypothetical protein
MSTPFIVRDLNKQAPHSPRERLAGFAIALRAVDKCLASMAGKLGQYCYDCPLDNSLFSFKGITGEQFKTPSAPRKIMKELEPGCTPPAPSKQRMKSEPGPMKWKRAA